MLTAVTGTPATPDSGLLAAPAAVGGSVAHAAAAALVVAHQLCEDPVRATAAPRLFALIPAAVACDGSVPRRHASTLVTLIHEAVTAEPRYAPLLLAFERWLLHPRRDSADELTSAADNALAGAPGELLRRVWVSGVGLEAALAEVDRVGFGDVDDSVVAVLAEAAAGVAPLTWLAGRCGTTRERLRHRLQSVHPAHVRPRWR